MWECLINNAALSVYVLAPVDERWGVPPHTCVSSARDDAVADVAVLSAMFKHRPNIMGHVWIRSPWTTASYGGVR